MHAIVPAEPRHAADLAAIYAPLVRALASGTARVHS